MSRDSDLARGRLKGIDPVVQVRVQQAYARAETKQKTLELTGVTGEVYDRVVAHLLAFGA